ncbi:MAG: carbohydrate binding domain-containing protein, partial [Planctomycetota bacterium]|nr:carbohydrate binding domain-containing protein [Planctomycetota bacterium]
MDGNGFSLLGLARGLAVIAVALAGVDSRAAAAQDVPAVVVQDGFEKGLEGWEKEGAAEFAVATENPHNGDKCARITVAAGEQPAYQKLTRVVDEKPTQGSIYHASVWVRTSGVAANPGAYVVIEYFDQDKRLDVSHGGMATDANAREWRQLEVEGTAPKGAQRVRVALLLHANGSAWFDDLEVTCMKRNPPPEKPPETCRIRLDPEAIVTPVFSGVGFHCSEHEHSITKTHMDQVLAKRWRELRPTFARLSDFCDWNQARRDVQANYILMMKEVGTQVYLTTWNPKDVLEGDERSAYAKKVVDYLEYLVRTKGCTNVKYYCMTNELSLKQWGSLQNDLPKFKSYHKCLYDELAARKLDIKLLATDASPVQLWHTIEWAKKNMDDITGIYGGHHYINDCALEDDRFYGWFLEKVKWGAGVARGKGFVLGEF